MFALGPIADPFLALLKRLLWTDSEPTIAEGKLAAVWTIEHVRRTNPGGVGGRIQVALLGGGQQELTTSVLSDGDVAEHLQRVSSAERALVAEVRGEAMSGATPPAPPAPNVMVGREAPSLEGIPARMSAASKEN